MIKRSSFENNQINLESISSYKSINDIIDQPYLNVTKCGIVSSFLATSHKNEKNSSDKLINMTCISNISFNASTQQSKPDLSLYKINYFGLFEGRKSPIVSDFLKRNFHSFLFEDEDFMICTYQSFVKAFEKAQNTVAESNIPISSSYGLIALMIDNLCFIASLGCSRCIMSTYNGNNIYQMTKDQDLNNEEEKERIEKNGGKIQKIQNINYLMPEMKKCVRMISNDHPTLYDSVVPDVVSFQIKENADFLILMNQGVFDYLTNEEIVYHVFKAVKDLDIRHNSNNEDTYKAIVKEVIVNCIKKGNGGEDIDIIIIFFDNFVKNFINPLQRVLRIDSVINAIETKIKLNNYSENYFDFISNGPEFVRYITIYDNDKKERKKEHKIENSDKISEIEEKRNSFVSKSITISNSIGENRKKKSFCEKVCSCFTKRIEQDSKSCSATQFELMKMQ